jgi:stage II sporulation protein D
MSGLEASLDIQDEDTFRAFIMDTTLNDYESAYGWYRWKVEVTLEELTVIVNTRLAKLSEALKSRVLTQQKDGTWREGASGVGTVESVTVLERGAGGVASLVEISGSQGTVRLLLQSAIREVLGSTDYVYQRNDGSTVTGRSTLVSAYFCLEPIYVDDVLSGYRIYGGGCGHGVGMSQNCANALGQSGVTAQEMLRFFYSGTEITRLYE